MDKLNILIDIFKKCYEISKNTKADCFFNFSPHVNSISIDVYPKGYRNSDDTEYIWLDECGEWQELPELIDINEIKADLIFKALDEFEKEAKSND